MSIYLYVERDEVFVDDTLVMDGLIRVISSLYVFVFSTMICLQNVYSDFSLHLFPYVLNPHLSI